MWLGREVIFWYEYLRSEEVFLFIVNEGKIWGLVLSRLMGCDILKLLIVCFGILRSVIVFMYSKLWEISDYVI